MTCTSGKQAVWLDSVGRLALLLTLLGPTTILSASAQATSDKAPHPIGAQQQVSDLRSAKPVDGIPAKTEEDLLPPLPNMQVFEGSGTFVKPPSAKIASSRSGDVTLDFTDADIKDVVRAIFGEILQCSYTIDPRVTGHITLKTGRPIAKEAVLQALETALKISGYAINLIDDIYNIVPAESVQRRAQITYGANDRQNAGYGIEVISLEYVSAEEMQRIINPLVPEGAIAQIDAKRNLIFLSGSEPDRAAIRETIARFDVNYLKGMSFALIQPAHSNVETLASELDKIFGEANSPIAGLVRLIPMQRINSLLVITSRRNYLKEVQRWVARLDVAPVTPDRKLYFYRLQNSRAHDIAEILGRIFGGNMSSGSDQSAQFGGLPHPAGLTPKTSTMSVPTGSSTAATQVQTPSIQLMPSQYGNSGGANMPQIVTDEANNALIIRADAAGYAAIEDVVRQMDVPPSQVMVEATIVEVTLNDTLKYGVEWYFKNAKETYTMSPNGAVATHFPGLGITYSATNLQAALSTLGSLTDVTVISSPKILTLDNKAATIEVGDQIPIVTQTAVSTTTSGSPIVSSVEQRDTGVILSVTPRIGNSGIVYLDVSQEVSTSTQTTTSNIDSPTIQQRRIHSTVAVNDGATIALGGLIQNSQTNGDSGIPFLKDIPVLGAAFSTKSNVRGRTELLIFLTPHVIRNLPAALDMTEKLKQDLEKVRNALDELPKHRVPRRPW